MAVLNEVLADALEYNSRGAVSIEDLGGVSLYDDPEFDCTDIIQDWIDDFGHTKFRPLFLPAKPYGITAGEIVFPKRSGYKIICGGGAADVRAETEWELPTTGANIGGPCTRLCKLGGSGAMLRFKGAGGVDVSGTLNIQGLYDRAKSRAQLLADSSDYADVGLWFTEDDDGVTASDSARFDGLFCLMCKVGVKQGVDFDDVNSNAINVQKFASGYCRKGFYAVGRQTVNNRFGQFINWGDLADHAAQVGLHVEAGGDYVIELFHHECPKLAVKCDVNEINAPSLTFNLMAVDAAANGGMLFHVTGLGGALVDTPTYSFTHINARLTIDDPYVTTIMAEINSATILNLSGDNFYNNCIRTISYTDGVAREFSPNVIIQDARFRDGISSLAAGAASGNTGRSDFRYRNCSKFDGEFYDDIDQIRSGNSVTSTRTYDFTVS